MKRTFPFQITIISLMYIERQSFSSLVNSEYKSNFGVVPISQKKKL